MSFQHERITKLRGLMHRGDMSGCVQAVRILNLDDCEFEIHWKQGGGVHFTVLTERKSPALCYLQDHWPDRMQGQQFWPEAMQAVGLWLLCQYQLVQVMREIGGYDYSYMLPPLLSAVKGAIVAVKAWVEWSGDCYAMLANRKLLRFLESLRPFEWIT